MNEQVLIEILTRSGAALSVALVLSIIIERSLSVVFAYRHYVKKLEGRGFKVPISVTVSLIVCLVGKIDVLSTIMNTEPTIIGYVLTALLISGGAKKFGEVFGDLKKGLEAIK